LILLIEVVFYAIRSNMFVLADIRGKYIIKILFYNQKSKIINIKLKSFQNAFVDFNYQLLAVGKLLIKIIFILNIYNIYFLKIVYLKNKNLLNYLVFILNKKDLYADFK